METNNKQKEIGIYQIIILFILSMLVLVSFIWLLIKNHSPYLIEGIVIFICIAIVFGYIGIALIINSYIKN